MSLSSTTNRVTYTASGSASVYAYSFKIFAAADLLVQVRHPTSGTVTTLAYPTDYTVSGVGETTGGNVTLVDLNQAWLDADGDLTLNYVISISRVMTLSQPLDVRNQGSFYPADYEDALDKTVMKIQQVEKKAGTAIRLAETDDHTAVMTLPLEADRASKFLAFNSDGEPIASAGGISGSVTVSAFGASLVDDANAGAALTTLGVSAFAQTVLDDATAATARATLGHAHTTTGDVEYASSATALARLGIGTVGKVMASTGSAPAWYDAEFGRNFIHNGAMDFWQRGTSFAAAGTAQYFADRFCYLKAVTGAAHTLSREPTIIPTLAESGFKSSYSLKVDCTTADAAVAAGDLIAVRYVIEGHDYARLKGREVTLSFWVYAVKTGTHCVAFRNNASDRSYVAEYIINTTNTWEKKTITLTLNPSGGTDDYTTGIGLSISWTLMGGSTFQTTAGAWATGEFLATANQVNACDSTSNDFYLAQVMLNLGGSAAPMSRAGGTIAGELALCQRYYEKSYAVDTAPATATNTGEFRSHNVSSGGSAHTIFYRANKRTSPTPTLYSTDGTSGSFYDATSSLNRTATVITSGPGSTTINTTATNAYTANAGDIILGQFTADAEFS